MHCVHCGNVIPEKHDFCSKCGKQSGVAKPAVRTGYVVALLVAFFVGLGTVIHLIRADHELTAASAPKLYTATVDAAFTLPQLHDKAYKFTVPVGARSAMIHGHFSATGGARNDVEVWVMSDDGYVNWQNGHSTTPIYNSGRVTQATLNVPLPFGPGTYYLVFNNRFSLISPKAVEDNLALQYER